MQTDIGRARNNRADGPARVAPRDGPNSEGKSGECWPRDYGREPPLNGCSVGSVRTHVPIRPVKIPTVGRTGYARGPAQVVVTFAHDRFLRAELNAIQPVSG